MDYEPGFTALLPTTADLLSRGNLVVHPDVRRVVLHGSRGQAGGYRPDSDVDLSLIVAPRATADDEAATLYREVIGATLAAWRGPVDLDLAVIFDTRACGLACFDRTDWDPAACACGGVDCFGLYKTQRGFQGFVDGAGVEVRRMYPCITVWRRSPVPPVVAGPD